jgi:hypothetical protein
MPPVLVSITSFSPFRTGMTMEMVRWAYVADYIVLVTSRYGMLSAL